MESIGQYLKAIRIKRDLSLEDLHQKTRISIQNLINIEGDQFDNMGGKGYAKANIITYGRALGADINLLMNEFEKIFIDQKPKTQVSSSISPRKYLISTNIFSILFLLILIVLLIVVSVKFYREGKLTSPFHDTMKPADKNELTEPDSVPDSSAKIEPTTQIQLELIQEEEILNASALSDTTDYLSDLLFRNKKSPFHYSE
ncbi:MAG: helix-turn-helix domain-containing protein [Candidatus Cloacimonetes bacterium]|nr:helix-turn-helix domain-containing protein [Candidatus Cloacimonadota bacterium]